MTSKISSERFECDVSKANEMAPTVHPALLMEQRQIIDQWRAQCKSLDDINITVSSMTRMNTLLRQIKIASI